MKVRIYDYVEGNEVYRGIAELEEAIPDRDERFKAEGYLGNFGRYWTGTAAALVLLMRIRD